MVDFFNNKARAAAAAAAAVNAESSITAPSKDSGRIQPWVEKYRPKTLNDVASQEHTVAVLQRTLQASNLPHMLFYGPPGTGKTSTILALAHSLFGPALFSSRVLELNASDERGISIVRSKIKDFARQTISHPPSSASYREQHPCPPYKLIILDEADSMTQDAQSALRRTMETYSKITRFCLICNYVTRIIDPLASRCSKFRFKSLDGSDAALRLKKIADAEGLTLEDGTMDTLIKCSDGDLRKAITFLQSAARLVGARPDESMANGQNRRRRRRVVDDEDDKEEDACEDMDVDMADDDTPKTAAISPQIITEIGGVVPDEVIERFVSAVQPPQPTPSGTTFRAVSTCVKDMMADGFSGVQILAQTFERLMMRGDETTGSVAKEEVLLVFSEADKCLIDGADEEFVILNLGLRVAGILAA